MVPLRTISEAFGAKVDWFAQDNKISVSLAEQQVELILGSKEMYVNGSKKELDVAAQSYHGRTYLPLRAIGEALEKSVSYEFNYKLIIITDSPEWVKQNYFSERFYITVSYAIDSKKEVLYGDNNLLVYYEDDGSLYLKDWFGDEYTLKSYYPYAYADSPFHWYSVAGKEYLVFDGAREFESDCVYQFKDGNLKPIYKVEIFDIRITDDYLYILAKDQGADPSFVFGGHSNLLKVNLQDYTEECLGIKGYVYGCILVEDSNSSTYIRDDWQVKDDGIYISGFYSLGEQIEIENTTGRYKVNLTVQSHEKLTS